MEKLIALKHKLDAIKTMGTNAKKEALANLDEFEQSMVSLMLNPFIRFGVKKYKVAEPLDTSVPSDQKVVELLEKLAARELTGNGGPPSGRGAVLRVSGRTRPVTGDTPPYDQRPAELHNPRITQATYMSIWESAHLAGRGCVRQPGEL